MKAFLSPDEIKVLSATLGLDLPAIPVISLAFLHPTWVNEHSEEAPKECFPVSTVGDEAFSLALQDLTMEAFPTESVGQVSDFVQVAYREIPGKMESSWDLRRFMRIGKGTDGIDTRGELAKGLLGGIYLSMGLGAVRPLVAPFLSGEIDSHTHTHSSYKTLLQEYVQERRGQFSYRLVNELGPAHSRVFSVEVSAVGHRVLGEGPSKKKAEEAAARALLERIAWGWVEQRARPLARGPRPRYVLSPKRREQLLSLAYDLKLGLETLPFLDQALTHSSAVNEGLNSASNERLIPVGACAISLSALQHLWENRDRYGAIDPHEASQQRGAFLSTQTREYAYDRLDLGRYVLVGRGMAQKGISTRMKADFLTALVGAIFVGRKNKENSPPIIGRLFHTELVRFDRSVTDPTSTLQELSILFGCNILLESVRAEGAAQTHTVRITLTDANSGQRTPLFWQGSDANVKKAAKMAARAGLQEITERIDLTIPQQSNKIWTAVINRLVGRLEQQGTRLQIKDKVVNALGGLGVSSLQDGNLTVGLSQLGQSLSTLQTMRLPCEPVLATVRRLGCQAKVFRYAPIVQTFEGLLTWFRQLTPDSARKDIAIRFSSLLELLELARTAATPATIETVSAREQVAMMQLLGCSGIKIKNEVTPEISLTVHPAFFSALLFAIFSSIRDVAAGTTVTVTAAGSDQAPALRFIYSSQMAREALMSRLDLSLELAQLQFSQIECGEDDIVLSLGQPPATAPESLKELFADLLLANIESLGQLAVVGTVVHDLKNQLKILQNRVQQTDLVEVDIPFLESRNSLIRLTEAVLHYIHAAAQPNMSEVNLYDFLSTVMRQVRSLARATSVSIHHRATLDREIIVSDETYLQSIVINLVKNAYEAMPDGGRLEFIIETAGNDLMLLSVKDTGVGIAPERLGSLFSRAQTTKGSSGGTGLGLMTVRRFVDSLGGEISVQSSQGQGTEFSVLLPLGGSSTATATVELA